MRGEGEGSANHLLRLRTAARWLQSRGMAVATAGGVPTGAGPAPTDPGQEMVQHGGPGPWQTNDDQRFLDWCVRDAGTALQILLHTQPVAEQPEALLAEGQAAEQVQVGCALIGLEQAPECLPKRRIPNPTSRYGAVPPP